MTVARVLRAAKHRAVRAAKAVAQPVLVRGVLAPTMTYQPRASESSTNRQPHLLIARYQYYASDPGMGPAIEQFCLDDTLRASELGTADTYFWETGGGFPHGDRALLERGRAVQPDLIVL